jgi:hypothetical protein
VDGVLREVVDSDLDAFFEHQREPEANRMAAFLARDREAFYAQLGAGDDGVAPLSTARRQERTGANEARSDPREHCEQP